MNPILIVKNIPHEGPGVFGSVLDQMGIDYEVVDLKNGGIFPDPEGYAGVIVLGGPDSANNTISQITQELEQVRKIIDLEIPYLGVCLGLQLLVKAGGGMVVQNKVREVGFVDDAGDDYRVELTEAGKNDPVFKNFDDAFSVFHLHGETVSLVNGMTVLGTGKWCKNQAVRVGKCAYGVQYHNELKSEMFDSWLEKDDWLLELDAETLKNQYQARQKTFESISRTMMENWLTLLGGA